MDRKGGHTQLQVQSKSAGQWEGLEATSEIEELMNSLWPQGPVPASYP